MRLRPRLLLTAALVAVPAAAVSVTVHYRLEWQHLEQRCIDFVHAELYERGMLERIESDPRFFPHRGGPGMVAGPEARGPGRGGPGGPMGPGWMRGGPGRGPGNPPGLEFGIFTYEEDFKTKNPRSPAFPEELRLRLEGGEALASTLLEGEETLFAVGWRTGEAPGPASWALITSSTVPDLWSPAALASTIAVSALMVAALIASLGPVVGRTRKLALAVRGLAQRPDSEVPVEGADEITDLARAIGSFRAAAEHAETEALARETSLRTFVENTAHDLGTPLTVLRGHLAQLRSENDAPALQAAIQETQYISALLENLSAVSRLEEPEENLLQDEIDLGQLVQRVSSRHEFLARERGVTLDLALPGETISVLGEMTLLEQALGNLVHNAIRYGRQGGHATVHLTQREPGTFELRVLDDGPGLDTDELRALGERRWRSEMARQRRPGGKGIGVAIARGVVERHGWSLTFASPEEGGLVATISGTSRVD